MKQEDKALYEVLKMEKEQIHAYIGLSKQKNEHLETTKLLDILNENARKKVKETSEKFRLKSFMSGSKNN